MTHKRLDLTPTLTAGMGLAEKSPKAARSH